MSNKGNSPKKTTIHDFFIKIVGALNLQDLPKYERFNLLSSAIIAIVAIALALPPVLALVNNIIISIGNIIIIALKMPEHIQTPNTSTSLTVILPLFIVFIEGVVCRLLCFYYKKNDTPEDGQ